MASPGRVSDRSTIGAVIVAAIVGLSMIASCAGNPGPTPAPTTAVRDVERLTPSPVSSVVSTTSSTVATNSTVAASTTSVTSTSAPATPAKPNLQESVQTAVARAAAVGVEQAVAVIDRSSGQLVASHAGDRTFNAESIGKLFTAAYYVIDAEGAPDAGLADDLRELITESNNHIQTSLWRADIIPTIADRYDLDNTSNSATESPNTWGSDQITAHDQANFLYSMSRDALLGTHLMNWMSATEPVGGDGFDQFFGFNALDGDHGSKQGWSDPGWSPANLHSVGWTERHFAAILQNSPSAAYSTMRSTSTFTAELIAAAG